MSDAEIWIRVCAPAVVQSHWLTAACYFALTASRDTGWAAVFRWGAAVLLALNAMFQLVAWGADLGLSYGGDHAALHRLMHPTIF